jgi:hypothetical protein
MYPLLLEYTRIRKEFFSETRRTEGSNLAHNLSPW